MITYRDEMGRETRSFEQGREITVIHKLIIAKRTVCSTKAVVVAHI